MLSNELIEEFINSTGRLPSMQDLFMLIEAQSSVAMEHPEWDEEEK